MLDFLVFKYYVNVLRVLCECYAYVRKMYALRHTKKYHHGILGRYMICYNVPRVSLYITPWYRKYHGSFSMV